LLRKAIVFICCYFISYTINMPAGSNHYTLLLIDDDVEEYELFEVAVAESGLPVTLSHTSHFTVDDLRTLPQPDFIFLDINMPVFDGFYWLKEIRKNIPEQIPIIIYSTTLNPQRVNLTYELGANLFLSKPDTVGSLITALENILHMDWSNPRELARSSFEKEQFHLT
jgi:CheY-like chemotaxis protein